MTQGYQQTYSYHICIRTDVDWQPGYLSLFIKRVYKYIYIFINV